MFSASLYCIIYSDIASSPPVVIIIVFLKCIQQCNLNNNGFRSLIGCNLVVIGMWESKY